MIDTDKYEGYEYERMNIERWHHPDTPEEVMIANARLMHDAPLLFEEVKQLHEEVKRLRKQLSKAKNWVRDYLTDINGNYQSYENKTLHADFMQQMGMKE